MIKIEPKVPSERASERAIKHARFETHEKHFHGTEDTQPMEFQPAISWNQANRELPLITNSACEERVHTLYSRKSMVFLICR